MIRKIWLLVFACSIIFLDSCKSANKSQYPDPGFLRTNTSESIKTKDLLDFIKWDSLSSACNDEQDDSQPRCYVRESKGKYLSKYRYLRQGNISSISITSYRDFVLKYRISHMFNSRPMSADYFDKPLWMEYAREVLIDLPEEFHISINERKEVLVAYYELLGLGVRKEYGWSDQSVIPSVLGKRAAVIELIKYSRKDLIRKALKAPNFESRIYAADALIYMDYLAKEEIRKLDDEIRALDSNSLKSDSYKWSVKKKKEAIDFFSKDILTSEDSSMIEFLKTSSQIVKTYGGRRSYDSYPVPAGTILSDSSVALIPEMYEIYRELGYFR